MITGVHRSAKLHCRRERPQEARMDSPTIYVLLVIFAATLIRSALGFGEALVAVPLLAIRLPISVAAPLAVLVSVAMAGIIVLQDWRQVQLRSATGLNL